MKLLVSATTVALIVLIACGGGSSGPTVPSESRTSAISGTYSGTITIVFPEFDLTLSCPASTSITQSGSTVNIAPLTLTGQCSGINVPLNQLTVDSTGALVGGASGSYSDPSCGTYVYTASGGISGAEFKISMTATSRTCWNMNITLVLAR